MLPEISHPQKTFVYPVPLWYLLTPEEQQLLAKYQKRHFRQEFIPPAAPRLKPIEKVLVPETPEEIDAIMRHSTDVSR